MSTVFFTPDTLVWDSNTKQYLFIERSVVIFFLLLLCPPYSHATIFAAHFSQAPKTIQRDGFKQDEAFSLPPFCPLSFHPQGAGCDKGRPDADGACADLHNSSKLGEQLNTAT